MMRRSVVLLLTSLAVATAGSDSRVMPVRYFTAKNPLPQGMAMLRPEDASGTAASLAGEFASMQPVQTQADDRSLKLIPKAVALGALHKWKKAKKHPLKHPFKHPKFPVLLGGAAATAAAASAAKGPLLGGPSIAPIAENIEFPIWKVHKYNGIDIRPVRLSEISPLPLLPPPSEAEDFQPIVEQAPREVNVPEPEIVEPVVYPEPPKTFIPAPTYGVPAQTYGVPAQTYGVPAETYGVPATSYGVPTSNFGGQALSGVPQLPFASSQPVSFPGQQPTANSQVLTSDSDDADREEGLEALSTLGQLTDFIPSGGSSESGSRFPSLFGGRGYSGGPLSFFSNLIRGQPAAEVAAEPVETPTVVAQPQQSAIHNLLGRIPLISALTNFGNGNTAGHVALPGLPELPNVPDIQNVRGVNSAIPQIPNIRLPTKYVVRGAPYVSIRYPQDSYISAPFAQAASVSGMPYNRAPAAVVPEPAAPALQEPAPAPVEVEPVRTETTYSLPVETRQQPQPAQIGYLNSYGAPVQTGYYVTPVISASAPAVPQFTLPFYSTPVATGIPALKYGVPDDVVVAASENDPATVRVECADGKSCGEARVAKDSDARVAKVAVPEGQTRPVQRADSTVTPAVSPVFKKDNSETKKVAENVEDMARYLDATHPAATKLQTPVMDDSVIVDAPPSTNTEDESS